MLAYRSGLPPSARRVKLLAMGMSGERTSEKIRTAATIGRKPRRAGNRNAAAAHSMVLARKIGCTRRVRSAATVHRKGAAMPTPGRSATRKPNWLGENPASRQKGARYGSKTPTAAKYQK